MELEEHKVMLTQRWNILKNHSKKEWWYTGVHDPASGVYLGFSLIRTALIDSFHAVLFDSVNQQKYECGWKGYIASDNPPDQLSLQVHNKKFSLDYRGRGELGWHCQIRAQNFAADLHSHATLPPFTKYDNMFDHEYTLLHFFGNAVEGFVQAQGKEFRFRNALGYYDHCFGKVPARSRWHWIAVQNRDFAIASLMNYGATAQCYTQCYSRVSTPHDTSNRWIRLDQDVSFEYNPEERWTTPWRITSPDMDLELNVIQRCSSRERIPPLVPFLISIDHDECFVNVRGKVRLDGHWQSTGDLFGVLEEHHGHW